MVDFEGSHTEESSEDVTEDGSTRIHWNTVYNFASDVTGAARSALCNGEPHFTKVVAVITCWAEASDLRHLHEYADALGLCFEETFNFEVLIYKIPNDVTERKFVSTIANKLDKVSNDRNSLFILYYGGHATLKESSPNGRLWKKENRPRSPEIEWSSVMRSLFKTDVICGKLFIFDCCHAGGMIDPELAWETSCELLGACGPDVQASALKVSSFTRGLLSEMSKGTYNVWELHAALCSTEKREEYNLTKYPHYQDFIGHLRLFGSALFQRVGHPTGVENHPQSPSKILDRLEAISDAVICVAITFNCTAAAFMLQLEEIKKNWQGWFKFAPTDFDDVIVRACRSIDLVAAFDSSSCITIWSSPVWLWDAMAPRGGYQYIGIIRPQNLALAAMSEKNGLPPRSPGAEDRVPVKEIGDPTENIRVATK